MIKQEVAVMKLSPNNKAPGSPDSSIAQLSSSIVFRKSSSHSNLWKVFSYLRGKEITQTPFKSFISNTLSSCPGCLFPITHLYLSESHTNTAKQTEMSLLLLSWIFPWVLFPTAPPPNINYLPSYEHSGHISNLSHDIYDTIACILINS